MQTVRSLRGQRELLREDCLLGRGYIPSLQEEREAGQLAASNPFIIKEVVMTIEEEIEYLKGALEISILAIEGLQSMVCDLAQGHRAPKLRDSLISDLLGTYPAVSTGEKSAAWIHGRDETMRQLLASLRK